MKVVYGVVALRERGIRGVLAVYCIVLFCIVLYWWGPWGHKVCFVVFRFRPGNKCRVNKCNLEVR